MDTPFLVDLYRGNKDLLLEGTGHTKVRLHRGQKQLSDKKVKTRKMQPFISAR